MNEAEDGLNEAIIKLEVGGAALGLGALALGSEMGEPKLMIPGAVALGGAALIEISRRSLNWLQDSKFIDNWDF